MVKASKNTTNDYAHVGVETRRKIWCYYTFIAKNKYTPVKSDRRMLLDNPYSYWTMRTRNDVSGLLEPCAVKVARTVLRGPGGGDTPPATRPPPLGSVIVVIKCEISSR